MEFRLWLLKEQKAIGPEDADRLHLFGPMWHGTTPDNRILIQQQGFQFFKGLPRSDSVQHGYEMQSYGMTGIPPPIHHLGFGTYFTRTKSIAKNFNIGSTKGLRDYYVGGPNYTSPKIEIINKGSPNTMMKWWKENGYDMPPIASFKDRDKLNKQWIKSTENLTNNLKSQFDAVWFKGKGFRRLLDGDQVCVYQPRECVYFIDWNLSHDYEIENGIKIKLGDRIQIKDTKATAYVAKISPSRKDDPWNWAYPSKYQIMVGNLKGMDEIASIHGPVLKKAIENADKNEEEFMASRRERFGTREQNIQQWYDYNIIASTFAYKVPSALIAKVLKPGERIK